MVVGVSEGYKKQLELVGVGYRATNKGQILELALGYSHPIVLQLPSEIKVEAVTDRKSNPIITLECADKQLIGQVCAKIRSLRKPEPYKGKGVRFVGEVVRRKAGVITSYSIHYTKLYERPNQGGIMARSAGTFAQLAARDGKFAVVKLPSGETRMILTTCRATLGAVGNSDHALERSGKAGRSRWLGRRPRVRGVVMNPVDHPMGGGEGRQSGGHPRSRTGLLARNNFV